MNYRGFFYVLLGILISSFIGGALNVLFSEERVREYVEVALTKKQPKFIFEFKKAKFKFAGQLLPSVAIELEGLSLKASDSCVTGSTLLIDNLLVPIRMSSFFTKKIQFGEVHANHARLFIRPAICSEKQSVAKSIHDFNSFERFLAKRWQKEVINSRRYIDGLIIRQLEFVRDEMSLSPVVLKDVEIELDNKNSRSIIEFGMQFGQPLVGTAEFGVFDSQIAIYDDEFHFQSEGYLQEGSIQLTAKWAISTGSIETKMTGRDMPASSLLKLIHNWSLLSTFRPSFKNQWANCDMSLTGDIRKIFSTPVKLHQCRLFGNYGEVALKSAEIKSLEEGGDLLFEIQSLNVKKALAAFDYARSWGLVSEFGDFVGSLKFTNRESYEIGGEIRNAEFYLSNFDSIARVPLDRMRVDLNMNGQKFTGITRDFSLREGELKGEMSFVYELNGTGKMQFNFDKIQLLSTAQQALWGGLVDTAKLEGEVQVKESKLAAVKAKLNMNKLQTLQWELSNVISTIGYTEPNYIVKSMAAEFHLRPESKWRKTLYSLATDGKAPEKEVFLRDLSTVITIEKDTISWRDLYARSSMGGIRVQSAGAWNSQSGFAGVAESIGQEKRVWNLGGDWRIPVVTAETAP